MIDPADYPKQINRTLNRVFSNMLKNGFTATELADFMDEHQDELACAALMGDFIEIYDLCRDELRGESVLDVFAKHREFCLEAADAGVPLSSLVYHYKQGDIPAQEESWITDGIPVGDLLA